MKFSALSMMAAVAVAKVGPGFGELSEEYTFSAFASDFNKTYVNDEVAYRRGVFNKALSAALAHNADASNTWKQSINQFSDVTPDEFKNSHGWLPSWSANVQVMEAPHHVPADFRLSDLPDSIDWSTTNNPLKMKVVTAVKNQGMCGSCWAFSSTENVESRVALDNNGTLLELSPQNLVSCDTNPNNCGGKGGCAGSIPELAFNFVTQKGLASEKDYPYVSGGTSANGNCKPVAPSAKIEGYIKLPANNYTAVMHALATVGPLAINVDAIPMQSYGGGLFTGCAQDSTHIDHVIQLVGYGTTQDGQDYWKVRNSWATSWGEQGYMQLQRHSPKDDWCSLDIYPADGTGCDNGPGTVTVCGSCGILYDVSYPYGGKLLK